MEEYLLDRETLGKFVDELIKKKALPVDNAEELEQLREKSMKELDDKISKAIFSGLSDEQKEELEQMFDRDEQDPEAFNKFFKREGIDIEKIMSDTMQEFGTEFLGGENA